MIAIINNIIVSGNPEEIKELIDLYQDSIKSTELQPHLPCDKPVPVEDGWASLLPAERMTEAST